MPGDIAQAVRHGVAADSLRDDDQHRVVAGHGAHDLFQPAAVEGGADDVGRARWRAQHHQVPRVRHLDHPLAEHPPQVVLGRDLVRGQLGERVGRLAPRQADLDRAEVIEVARHRRLGGLDALLGQQRHQLRLAGHRLGLEQLGDAVLALVLGQAALGVPAHRGPPTAQARIPRMAVRRWAAWRQTSDRGPSRTSSVISSPRWAGRQCSTTASAARQVDQLVVDGEALERREAGRPLLLLAHAGPHVGVEHGCALGRLARVVGQLHRARHVPLRRRTPAGRPAPRRRTRSPPGEAMRTSMPSSRPPWPGSAHTLLASPT